MAETRRKIGYWYIDQIRIRYLEKRNPVTGRRPVIGYFVQYRMWEDPYTPLSPWVLVVIDSPHHFEELPEEIKSFTKLPSWAGVHSHDKRVKVSHK